MSKTKAITNELSYNVEIQKTLLRIMLFVIVSLGIGYVYLIGSITFNVVARKSLEGTIVGLTNEVKKLEITYLNDINKIDKDYALSKGFVEIRQGVFTSRADNHVAIR